MPSVRLHHAALGGHLLTLVGFLLPWAVGAGPFAARDFTGPQLASLARNTDLLITHAGAGAVAFGMVAAIYAVPVAAATGLLLLAGASWTSSPAAARRTAAGFGVLALAMTLITVVALQLGPGAGDVLRPLPGPGVVMALLGTLAASLSIRAR